MYLSYIRNQTLISRPRLTKALERMVGNHLVTVITGMRRSGKSTLLFEYVQNLESSETNKANVFFFTKELDLYDSVKNAWDLGKLLERFETENGQATHVLVDEIQDVREWEKFIRYAHATKRYSIVITGSNAHLLSGEMATYLSGRYVTLEVFPLTYHEFLAFSGRDDSPESIRSFLLHGGLPEIAKLGGSPEKEWYLRAVCDSVVLKDVVQRHDVRDVGMITNILSFFADNIGSLTTFRNIVTFFRWHGTQIALPTVLNYVSHFREAYLLHEARRYDLRGKKLLEINNKYYFSDTWLRNSWLKRFNMSDVTHLLENAVYTTFRSYGYDIRIGKFDAYEIDFIVERNGEKTYVQVSYSLAEETTWEREVRPLLLVRDAYPKYIVTLDAFRRWSHEGIRIVWFEELETYIR